MTTHLPVTIKSDRVCGTVQPNDIASATFTLESNPTSADQTKASRHDMQLAMKTIVCYEICTAYVPLGHALITKVTLDGVAQPAMNQDVIWVQPTDGYTIGP